MLDLAVNFLIGLTFIGVPSFIFYKLGVDAGIKRGIRLQVFRGWKIGGAIDTATVNKQTPPPDG